MSKLMQLNLKLCKTTIHFTTQNNTSLYIPNLILKKYVNFNVPAAFYVNQSKPKSSSTVEFAPEIATDKPRIVPAWRPTPSTDRTNLIQHYLKLSKIRLTTLVVVTAMGGYAVAPAPFEWNTFLLCVVGTGLLSGAANAINQFHEVPFDAQMARTKQRVLVCGRLTPLHSVLFATVTSITGLSILNFGVNGLTAYLGLANLVLYTGIYTPMKRMSILNTWVGSIVGAIPPLMGWAACAGTLGPGAWIMAALLYSWQFPHFNALSWNLRPDYSKAGYRMMSVTNPGLCKRVALRHTVALQFISIAAPIFDTTNWWFLLECTPLNLYFIYLAYQFYKDASSKTSRKLFRFSLLHLPLIMVLFLLNKKKWFVFEEENEDLPLGNDSSSISKEINVDCSVK